LCFAKEIIMQELSNKVSELLFELYEMMITSFDQSGRLYHEFDLAESYIDDVAYDGWDIALRVTFIGDDESEDVEISYYCGGDPLTEKELNEIYEYLLEKQKSINVKSRN